MLMCDGSRHVEGKIGGTGLVSLPDNLFVDMRELALLHLGVHTRLAKLPSFSGLSNLKKLILAYLFSITELPPFASPTKLKRIILVYLPRVASVPDMTSLTSLHEFVMDMPMQICCNGFLGADTCDLTQLYCTPDPDLAIPVVTCLSRDSALVATPGTQRVFQANAKSVCLGSSTKPTPEVFTREAVKRCEGVRFRQCEVPVVQANGSRAIVTGMCSNDRLQVLACTLDADKIAVRKMQIQRGVGQPCDPQVEAWLGCA